MRHLPLGQSSLLASSPHSDRAAGFQKPTVCPEACESQSRQKTLRVAEDRLAGREAEWVQNPVVWSWESYSDFLSIICAMGAIMALTLQAYFEISMR